MLRKYLCQGFVIVAAFAITTSISSAATKIGKVVAVVGSPAASGPGGSRTLEAGSAVFEDDTIKVATGNAQMILDDGTRLVVGPGSTLLLDKFLKRGDKADKVAIKALRGTFRFISGKSPKKAYDIKTASATIGIRGTGFDFWVKKKTGVIVMIGAVNLRGNNGQEVDLSDNCDMGVAGNDVDAEVLQGKEKSDTIGENLPFIADQRNLTKAFFLPISKCRPFIAIKTEGGKTPPVADPPDNNNNGNNNNGNNPD